MDQLTALNTALRLVSPNDRPAVGESFILHEGNVFYKGIHSSFILRNLFAERFGPLRMSLATLMTLFKVGKNVSLSLIDGGVSRNPITGIESSLYDLEARCGSSSTRFGAIITENPEYPDIPLELDDHRPFPELVKRTLPLLDVGEQVFHLCGVEAEGMNLVGYVSASMLAAAAGPETMVMNLGDIPTVMRTAISLGATQRRDRQRIIIHAPLPDDRSVTAMVRTGRVGASDKSIQAFARLISSEPGLCYPDPNGVTAELEGKTLSSLMETAQRVNSSTKLIYTLANDQLVLEAPQTGQVPVSFIGSMPCASSRALTFRASSVHPKFIEFICTLSVRTTIQLDIYPGHGRALLRTRSGDGEFRGLVCLPIRGSVKV